MNSLLSIILPTLLVAQADPSPKQDAFDMDAIFKILISQGFSAAAGMLILWLMYNHGPRIAGAAYELLEGVKTSNAKNAEMNEKLTQSVAALQSQGLFCRNTNAALLDACEVIEINAKSHPDEKDLLRAVARMRATLKQHTA
jgi:hypothetical protein